MMDRAVSRISHALKVTPSLTALAVVMAFGHVSAEEGERADLPWALRDHYTVTVGNARFLYALENAEWSIEADGPGTLVDHVGFAVTLGEAVRLEPPSFKTLSNGRERVSNALGAAAEYSVTLSSGQGLRLRHSVCVYKEHPFVTIGLRVSNEGSVPISIAKTSPVVMGPDTMVGYGSGTEAKRRWLTSRGPYPLFTKDALPLSIMFVNPAHDATLALGALPGDVALSGAQFDPTEGAWQGEMVSIFEPPLRLDPGATLDADPVWVCFAVPSYADAAVLFSWALAALPRPSFHTEIPDSWVTVENDAPAEALYEAARYWSRGGVRHALVPGSWAADRRWLRWGAAQYPRNMSTVAATLERMGVRPGITVDPLIASGFGTGWKIATADGQHWVRIGDPKARDQAVQQMEKVVKWGFRFFVVQPSPISDEVLHGLNVTRSQAHAFAFDVMSQAAGGLPVLPAAEATLKADPSAWLEAASSVGGIGKYGVGVGPVRLDLAEIATPSDALTAAVGFFDGPVEIVGTGQPSLRRPLGKLLQRNKVSARPLDAADQAPKVWDVPIESNGSGHRCTALVMFPGAPAWDVSSVPVTPKGTIHAWLAGEKTPLDLALGYLPATDTLTVYMLAPALARPVLIGAIGKTGLPQNHVTEVRWDESTTGLTGNFHGGWSTGGTAYVFIPEGWRLQSGRVGSRRLWWKPRGSMMRFPVSGDKDTPFELSFRRE